MDEIAEIQNDLAHLARLASQESYEDVRLYVARLVRKYRRDHPEFADRLDQSLRRSQTRGTSATSLRRGLSGDPTQPIQPQPPVDSDSKLSLVKVFDDRNGLARPLLEEKLTAQIDSIIHERQQRLRLESHGIAPTKSAILVGPPGVGKTLSARWIASQLDKPLWVLDLTAVMSSLLGKTGNNLRAAMDYAKEHEAILLLDEIDAIAKRRSDDSDVGELKRLVTVILQEVDQWPNSGLLLSATNHPELVDPALWRRFDAVLTFENPDSSAVDAAIRRFLANDLDKFAPAIGTIAAAAAGQSLSDIERMILSLRRTALLHGADPVDLASSMAMQRIHTLDKTGQIDLAIALAKTGVYSHHEIHRVTGVARDTIRKHAGPSPRKGRGLK
ncbi:AAA family ATPase [Paraburkholderia sp. Tr-20389]|uniref:AAA family ATPase n=1 Tax=Paraburkholderia sp. Tr-20389 TaxID=2703903 RepID=UPI0019812EBE|nr:ATP-binding protein [Paraburkholderia sp. Tr-20389]MBN3758187.1 AAA family ATPase [Paraburkholderia sp. Tr-20389]